MELEGLPTTEELEEEMRLRDLVRFVPAVSPRYMEPRHLAPLARRIELAAEGIPQRVCCSAPPRHAKTETVLHVPAFVLRRRPEWTVSYSGYGDRLAKKGSRTARRIAARLDIATTGNIFEWRTEEGGGMLAGGVGGPLTGFGVNLAIVDDPVKNRVEAESANHRARMVDWMRDVLMTRIEPGGSIFVFATRWHPDDLIGELIDEGFENINLPALGRVVDGQRIPDIENGEALWPERWSTEAMRARLDEVGEFTATSLFQGQPRPRGSQVFNDVYTYEEPPRVYRTSGGIDSAYSDKKTADFSAYVKMRKAGGKYYVVDAKRVREPAPHFKARLHKLHEPGMAWRWYVATTELGAAQLFAGSDGVPVHGMVAKADKFIRALDYAAAWNRGDVLVPQSAPWLDDFLSEHASFTGVNDKRDDLIDAAVAAFDVLDSDTGRTFTAGDTDNPAPLRSARI